MFSPRCNTIINKMYEPKKDMRKVHNKIKEWIYKIDEMITELEEYNKVFDNIYMYENSNHFPIIDIQFYKETLEGWKLIKERNKLKEAYPRQYKQVLEEERKERREVSKMMKEDDENKL